MRRSLALVALIAMTTACGGHASTPSLPDIETQRCATSNPVPATPPSLPALTQLAGAGAHTARGPSGARGARRRRCRTADRRAGRDLSALARELRAASDVACSLATPEDAERAGYVLSSNFTQGVGTHWTNWHLVDQPFDPTRPSMLLYATRLGAVRLIGFSYWVRTSAPDGPAGFTGSADRWHRHFGLCFDRQGLLGRGDIASAKQCAGVWLNGADMWMLHAWIVPGDANPWGLFAPINPTLCSRTAPDIDRCPGFS